MYFQAGEYGSKTHRPHYHAIVYDLPIKQEDLKIYKKARGFTYYNCEWLEKNLEHGPRHPSTSRMEINGLHSKVHNKKDLRKGR